MWLPRQLNKKWLGPQFLIPVKSAFLKCVLLLNTFPFVYRQIRNRCYRLLTNVLIIPFYILVSVGVPSVSRPLSYWKRYHLYHQAAKSWLGCDFYYHYYWVSSLTYYHVHFSIVQIWRSWKGCLLWGFYFLFIFCFSEIPGTTVTSLIGF